MEKQVLEQEWVVEKTLKRFGKGDGLALVGSGLVDPLKKFANLGPFSGIFLLGLFRIVHVGESFVDLFESALEVENVGSVSMEYIRL
jgi:hypothetical protein